VPGVPRAIMCMDWTTQAAGQRRTGPLCARTLELILSQMAQKPMLRGEVGARAYVRRSDVKFLFVVRVIAGRARVPQRLVVDDRLWVGNTQEQQAASRADSGLRANCRPRVDNGC